MDPQFFPTNGNGSAPAVFADHDHAPEEHNGGTPVRIDGVFTTQEAARLSVSVACTGDCRLAPKTRIQGDLWGGGHVSLGEACRISGRLISAGRIEWGRGSRVDGAVHSTGPFIVDGTVVAARLDAEAGIWPAPLANVVPPPQHTARHRAETATPVAHRREAGM